MRVGTGHEANGTVTRGFHRLHLVAAWQLCLLSNNCNHIFFLNLKCLQCLTRVYFTKICIFCEKVQARFSKMMALAFSGLLNCQLYVFLSDFSQH